MKYLKILIKLSGEALAQADGKIDPQKVAEIAGEIKEIQAAGTEVAIVIGGGNIYRGGETVATDGLKEETTHYMGILASCINGLALPDLFEHCGVPTIALSAVGEIGPMGAYSIETAQKILDLGKLLILAGGTGKPFCTTDSGAALRAEELNCDVIFKATHSVDGVYDSDPLKNTEAKRFDALTFDEVLEGDLKVMDRGAFELCKENNIPILVFKMDAGNIKRAAMGEKIGTIIN